MLNRTRNPKEQLELLAAHQQEFESFLHERTGLNVKVSFSVHTIDNSTADLLHLFTAGLSLPNFEQRNASKRIWIAHKDLTRNISIFMPKGFNADELYPEPEDDEGYAQAVEVSNADKESEDERSERSLYDDATPF